MISAVLLAYNEEESLPKMIPAVAAALHKLGDEFRIIVVDDGSKDGTAAAARALAKDYPVVLLQHEVNRGVAAAFDTGLRRCASGDPGDVVFTMEADVTNDPAALPAMYKALEKADVVIASRYRSGGDYVGFPLKRRILSWGANLFGRVFFGVSGVSDYTYFYRGYRVAVLQRALEKFGRRFIQCSGFASNAEILVKVAKAGKITVAEVPSVYRYDLKPGASKMRVLKNLLEYGKLLWISVTA